MLEVRFTTTFKKDLKRVEKQNRPIEELFDIVDLLRQEIALPQKNRDHLLSGEWKGARECHIEPDWLLVYRKDDDSILKLIRTGTHSDLF